MKNSLWKLTALAGVVGIVLLAFLQAQQGINSSAENGDFVPADLDEFAGAEPDLGDPSDEDAPPFDAVDGSHAAVGDPVDSGTFDDSGFGEGDFDSGAFDVDGFDTDPATPDDFGSAPRRTVDSGRSGFAADDWATDPSAESPPGRDELTPIRRRRDDAVRTADGRESLTSDEPRVLRVGDERLQPVPRRGDGPKDPVGDPAFDEDFAKEEFDGEDDFGPDLFSQDPPGTEGAPGEMTDDDALRRRPRLPLPERFDGELKPIPAGATADPTDEFPEAGEEEPAFGEAADFGTDPKRTATAPAGRETFSDDFPPLEDEPARRTGPQSAADDYINRPIGDEGAAPKLAPFPPLDDEPSEPVRRINVDSGDRRPPREPRIEIDPSDDEAAPFDTDVPPLDDPELGNPRALELDAPDPLPLETVPFGDDPADDAPRTTIDAEPGTEPNRVTPPRDAERLERDDLLGNATVDESTQVAPQRPRLTIEKLAPEHALLGQPMVYTIMVKNVGETPARQVVVHDRIPKGTELTGTIPRAELVERSADEGDVEKVLRWKLGTIDAGATKKIAVRVTPISEGQVGSVATVNFVAEVAARTRVTSPSLEFSLTGPSKARLGKPAMFQFDVRNSGSDVARGVVIRDLVPAGLKHPGGDDLEYVVGDLEPGASKSIRLSLTAVQEGEVVNRAVATADGGVKVESTARVQVVGTDLAVSRTGPGKRYVGRAALFTNVVANNGDVPLENVTVVEALPKGVDFVEAAGGGQYNATRHEVAWRLDRLGPKESRVLKVKLLPKAPGKFTCSITAKSDTGQEASTSAVTQAIGYTSLGLDVEGAGPPVFVGDTVTFTITPINRGTTNAANVSVEVEISPELEVASVNAPTKHTRVGNKVKFTAMPTLGGGAKAGYELTLRAVAPGEGRVRTSVVADDLTRPLQQDAAVRVVSETP